MIAVVLPDGTFIPTTWQESSEDTRRHLGVDDVQLTLKALVENVE